ncbi:hypothetical protein, partial [Massilia sp. CCM 8734]|uniref:hypothetical protein n=1 Tax=Massilia sp. CCM 8734 TaxID=2609283 RepID=UPI001AAE1F64
DVPFNRVGHPLPATIENTADEVSYRPASNALAVHETFRLAACRTWDRRLQKYLGRSLFRRFLGQ